MRENDSIDGMNSGNDGNFDNFKKQKQLQKQPNLGIVYRNIMLKVSSPFYN